MIRFRQSQKNEGFTLMEIMITVAIIGMLAVIAIPNYIRARKRAQANQVLSDLRMIDQAIQIYMLETNKGESYTVEHTDLVPYLKTGSGLANSQGKDMFGNSFTYDADRVPKVSMVSFAALSVVAPRSFWSPFIE
jgi:prepilin-type N-terminal cleavage/methylation domain-containing protein